jgi:sarcosine oxidase subunit beta
MDHPGGYRPQGYMFLATEAKHMDYLNTNFDRQVALGLKTVKKISRTDAAAAVPQLFLDDVIGGTFCSTDGFVDPYSVMTGFWLAAQRRGARLLRDTEVTGILKDAKGIAGVQTAQGEIATRNVVNAAGAWAGGVAKLAGLDLPVEPLRRMLVPTEPFPMVSQHGPMVVDMSTGFHFRPEGLGLLLAWNDPQETPGFKMNFDHAFIEKVLTHGSRRLPCLEEAEVNPKRAWAGLYEMTPDHHPILGPAPGVPGLFLANGFSGHGVMHSPATGKILADLILTGRCDLVDTRLLNLERFAEGREIHETAVL